MKPAGNVSPGEVRSTDSSFVIVPAGKGKRIWPNPNVKDAIYFITSRITSCTFRAKGASWHDRG